MTDDTHGKNDHRFDDLLANARQLGVAAGKGKDTLIQFAILMVHAAYDGVIDLTKNKHGDQVDDAVKAYSEYHGGLSGATIFNHKNASGKVQASKLRACVKLGGWTRGGQGEPIGAMNAVMGAFEKMRRNPAEVKQLDDAYNVLLKFARFQVKQSSAVSDPNVIRSFCIKAPSQTKTLEDYLQSVAKSLDDLRTGRAASGALQHSSNRLTHVTAALRAEITDLRKA